MSVPTFREWCRIKGRNTPFQDKRSPIFTPTEKRAGDLVLGAGGKWSAVS